MNREGVETVIPIAVYVHFGNVCIGLKGLIVIAAPQRDKKVVINGPPEGGVYVATRQMRGARRLGFFAYDVHHSPHRRARASLEHPTERPLRPLHDVIPFHSQRPAVCDLLKFFSFGLSDL